MELGGTAQGLAGADVSGALAGVMDQDDGEAVSPLQLAQVSEQRGDFAADVLVDAMQADEGIEDEQPRLEPVDSFLEAGAIGVEVETQAGGGDDLDVDVDEFDPGGGA